ncbi:TRAP transporter small permease [Rhodobacteraceae bacterium]|nr:TRAP transporter small permease [Paracoccaceae bacterium]
MIRKGFDTLAVATKYIATAANIAGTLVVLGLVVIVNFDVVARGVFNQPFRGAVEVVQFSMVLIVFLQLPDVVRINRLTASDGFLNLVGHRFPRFSRGLRIFINTIAMLFMGAIAVTMYPEFVDMWDTQDFFGVPGIFTAPWWPIKLVITLSAGLCAILFAMKLFRPSDDVQLVRLLPESDEAAK